MPIFDFPFSLHIPTQFGYLKTTFFVNQNLHLVNKENHSKPHNHLDYEIRYVESGECKQLINNHPYALSQGDLLIVHPWEYHSLSEKSISNQFSQYSIRVLIAQPTKKSEKAYHSLIDFLNTNRILHDSSGKLMNYFQQLTDEIYHRKNGYFLAIKSLCSLILIEVIRISNIDMSRIFPPDELKFHGFTQTQVDAFFREKYLSNVKIHDLANDLHLSIRQVNNIMYKMFGMSFSKKLIEMRLEHAANQLMYTDLSIQQIGLKCGFDNQNNFSQNFKRVYGLPPSKFRKEKKQSP